MKRITFSFIICIAVICVMFISCLVYLDKTEWTLREKAYNLNVPIVVKDGTIDEIEKQVKVELRKFGYDMCLSAITWETRTHNGFEKLAEGKLMFEYYQNIGNANGYYSYDRYIQYKVNVDLELKEITEVKTYGNFQLGGSELNVFPEFAQIRQSVRAFWKDKGIAEPYEIQRCILSVDPFDEAMLICRIKDNRGTEKVTRGKLSAREYVFIENPYLGEQEKMMITNSKTHLTNH